MNELWVDEGTSGWVGEWVGGWVGENKRVDGKKCGWICACVCVCVCVNMHAPGRQICVPVCCHGYWWSLLSSDSYECGMYAKAADKKRIAAAQRYILALQAITLSRARISSPPGSH